MTEAPARQPLLDFAVWSNACRGEQHCGDMSLVASFEQGALVAVVDGCGHGPEAAAAAQTAVNLLENHPEQDVAELMRRCHQQLRQSRGAVVGLASFHGRPNLLTWLGVGNLEAHLWRRSSPAADKLLLRAGIAGYNLPPLQPLATTVAAGDLLLLATDGIRAGFADSFDPAHQPHSIAAHIGEHFATGSDDGLILVARYLGWPE